MDSTEYGPGVLAGYALAQVACICVSYLAVTSFGFGSRGFMHVASPWYFVFPLVWLVVLYYALSALAPRVRDTA